MQYDPTVPTLLPTALMPEPRRGDRVVRYELCLRCGTDTSTQLTYLGGRTWSRKCLEH